MNNPLSQSVLEIPEPILTFEIQEDCGCTGNSGGSGGGSGGGSTINTARIPFNNETVITLASYQSAYYPLYGNTPIVVQIFVQDLSGGFEPDYGTAPVYTYLTPGNPASGIVSIAWGYGVATSGYILISGVAP
jgi:hypothetical protein